MKGEIGWYPDFVHPEWLLEELRPRMRLLNSARFILAFKAFETPDISKLTRYEATVSSCMQYTYTTYIYNIDSGYSNHILIPILEA